MLYYQYSIIVYVAICDTRYIYVELPVYVYYIIYPTTAHLAIVLLMVQDQRNKFRTWDGMGSIFAQAQNW